MKTFFSKRGLGLIGTTLAKLLYSPGGRGGGHSLILAIWVCAAPKSMVFGPFWSENGYTLWFGIGYGFRGNYGSV